MSVSWVLIPMFFDPMGLPEIDWVRQQWMTFHRSRSRVWSLSAWPTHVQAGVVLASSISHWEQWRSRSEEHAVRSTCLLTHRIREQMLAARAGRDCELLFAPSGRPFDQSGLKEAGVPQHPVDAWFVLMNTRDGCGYGSIFSALVALTPLPLYGLGPDQVLRRFDRKKVDEFVSAESSEGELTDALYAALPLRARP